MNSATLWWRCRRKQRYENRLDAQVAQAKAHTREGFPIYVYFCRHCKGYHLTKQDQQKYIARQGKERA